MTTSVLTLISPVRVGNTFDVDEGEQTSSVGLAIQVALSEHRATITFPASSHQRSSWEPSNVELYSNFTLGFVTGSPQLTEKVQNQCNRSVAIVL